MLIFTMTSCYWQHLILTLRESFPAKSTRIVKKRDLLEKNLINIANPGERVKISAFGAALGRQSFSRPLRRRRNMSIDPQVPRSWKCGVINGASEEEAKRSE